VTFLQLVPDACGTATVTDFPPRPPHALGARGASASGLVASLYPDDPPEEWRRGAPPMAEARGGGVRFSATKTGTQWRCEEGDAAA